MANTSVFGICRVREEAIGAIEALRHAGYRPTDVSALVPENPGTRALACEKHTKAPEGLVTGMMAGVAISAGLTWLVILGQIAVPGVEMLRAVDPYAGVLAGAGAGAIIMGLFGAIFGLLRPEYVARRFAGAAKKGGILISVHCDNSEWVSRARRILRESGARYIASAQEAPADFARYDKPRPRQAVSSSPTRL
jgi:hypothetical protein